MTEADKLVFWQADKPVDERVRDLVARMTLEEKIESMVQYQPAIERLGVSAYKHGTEAAHGVAWLGEATSFPQTIGLGCTWHPQLMKQIGDVIGQEARVYYQRNPEINGLTLWAPTVDMERDPRWGRTEEAYGEDPKLTGELTAALISGIQGDHPKYYQAIATLKHFIANNNEVDRGTCSASLDPRNMKEYYQAAFRIPFVKGKAKSMMTSYNSVNGTPTILHEDVNKVVKGEWDMDGFIVSDAGDLLGIVNEHKYFETYKEAVASAIKAGIDSITDDKEKSCAAIREALEEGLLSEQDLDSALFRTFRVRFWLGEFDPADQVPYANMPESRLLAPEHASLSRQAARESVVLLKNEQQLLPLAADEIQKVAVVGPLADVVYRDWYSGTMPYKVTPLAAIRQKLAGKQVEHHTGSDHIRLRIAGTDSYLQLDNSEDNRLIAGKAGEQGATFVLQDWGWGSYVLQCLENGKLVSSSDDQYLRAVADEAFGWYVKEVVRLIPQDDKAEVNELRTWNGQGVALDTANNQSLKLMPYESEGSSSEGATSGSLKVVVELVHAGRAAAVEAAKSADTAIVVVGNNPLINGKEEIDRPGLALAKEQHELALEVIAANPRTVVVVIGSYPFALGEISERAEAILYLAHAGQEIGNGITDILFGDYAPAGKLNMTWYRSESQLPDLLDYDIRKGKRTYQYFDGDVLYPFGHGLTYSTFSFGAIKLTAAGLGLEAQIQAQITISNVGSRSAEEVVQLYVHAPECSVQVPIKKLVGFERVVLEAGAQITLHFSIDPLDLAIWDVSQDRFVLESGMYVFQAGSSSEDIRIKQALQLEGETIPPRSLSLPVPAYNYDEYEAVILNENGRGGYCVEAVRDGSLLFRRVDWKTSASALSVQLDTSAASQQVAVLSARLNSEHGQLLGEANVDKQDGWQTIRLSFDDTAKEALSLLGQQQDSNPALWIGVSAGSRLDTIQLIHS